LTALKESEKTISEKKNKKITKKSLQHLNLLELLTEKSTKKKTKLKNFKNVWIFILEDLSKKKSIQEKTEIELLLLFNQP
jgi:hypothetical protein